ncbi:MAG TPA: vitamin K epoxide reductase family protein [Acidimicrobiales bacterium]|nr:vitamin K epoxide reductase family protein [Acidimicrobiales bacterium]
MHDVELDGGATAATPRWPWVAGLVLCALGVADAAYLTYAHFTTATVLACPSTGFVNCAKVTTSSYSRFLGMPVAVLGLAFFVGMVPLQTPWAWRSQWRLLRAGRMAALAGGVAMVVWLMYAEFLALHNLCEYCTGVHAITLVLFATTLFGTLATTVYADDDGDPGAEGVDAPSGVAAPSPAARPTGPQPAGRP